METFDLSPRQQSRIATALNDKRPLVLLNIFRALLSGLFCLLYLLDELLHPLGSFELELFFYTSSVYFLFSLAYWGLLNSRLSGHFLTYIALFADIILLTILMHSSGGIQSGLGVLLVVTIATGSIVLPGRIAVAMAAFASLVILIQQIITSFVYPIIGTSYPQAGILGTTFFTTAIVVHALARRIRESEALALQRGVDLANMAQLTEHIIHRMQTGIIVVDANGIIRLINESATRMLDASEADNPVHLSHISSELFERLEQWSYNPGATPLKIKSAKHAIDILPRFASIGDQHMGGILIFLQDMAATAQQAQQLQLASLGRLTASIAHEIRNPLGAISHAGQLLAESENLDPHDQRLTSIISDHTKRLNTIVENIMSVSRRQPSHVEIISLKKYLEQFMMDYTIGQDINPELFALQIDPDDTEVRFDTSHLTQILVNLCDNALRHGETGDNNKPAVLLVGGLEMYETRPHLDVIDNGPGVPADIQSQIFEPFFTTEASGTGLGLYLSRELAEANQARLNYMLNANGGGFFRITFQDPRRHIE